MNVLYLGIKLGFECAKVPGTTAFVNIPIHIYLLERVDNGRVSYDSVLFHIHIVYDYNNEYLYFKKGK